MKPNDTYEAITAQIIGKLEAGVAPWRMTWAQGGAGATGGGGLPPLPLRSNGEFYRGINILLLWGAADLHNFRSARWLTFKQALELGGAVRKGEKGTRIVFFKSLNVTDTNPETGAETDRSVPMLKSYTVFNADQIDGLPDDFDAVPVLLPEGAERDHAAEMALRSSGAQIFERGDRAFYSPAADAVTVPDIRRFESVGAYLATLAHELVHWTGHKQRLDRDFSGRFNSDAYAFEELVAEIGAAFVMARLGIVGEHIDNHAAYLSHWLRVMKADKRAIFKAASLAQAAADLVLANMGQGEPCTTQAPEAVQEPAPAELADMPMMAAPVDADRLAALVRVRVQSPMRPVAGVTASVDGLGLFDTARQLALF
jgi:antirestriction protein ArdC